MAKYDYHLIIDKEYREGTIKAENYNDAKHKIWQRFRGRKIVILELMEHINYFKQLGKDATNLFSLFALKILPIALGIIIIYTLIKLIIR